MLGGAPQGKVIEDRIFSEYKKANPNVSLNIQMTSGFQDLYQKLLTALAGNTPPDLSRGKDYWTPQFGTRNTLVALDNYLKAEQIDPKRYNAQRWDSTQLGGKTLGAALDALPAPPVLQRDPAQGRRVRQRRTARSSRRRPGKSGASTPGS